MYRWSGTDSYILGVFSGKVKAIKSAKTERDNRGGNKYFPEVIECSLDMPYQDAIDTNQKVILSRTDNSKWGWWENA